MEAAAKGSRDGRTVRAERTRQALVDALLALLYEGQLQPTAERISERAGVSERSLFQHFADREALYQAVAVQQYERIVPTLEPIDVSLPLPERIDAFVAQRARLLETVTPVRRAALLLEPESEVVSGWLHRARRQKAREVERVFRPELERIEGRQRGAVLARSPGSPARRSRTAPRPCRAPVPFRSSARGHPRRRSHPDSRRQAARA